jgi:pectin methylesterase-like acyl-CoA thioesterase
MEYVQDCASLTIDADNVTIRGITIENTFDKPRLGHLPNTQALALRTRGDRIVLERCRILGHQDTVLLDAPSWAARRRVHLLDCEIQGDVDFIYGRATALIQRGTIRSIGRGYIAAPSTALENPRGFLFWDVDVVGELPAGSVKLGRPWHPGGNLCPLPARRSHRQCPLG